MMKMYFLFLKWLSCALTLTCLTLFVWGTFFETPYLSYQNLPFTSLQPIVLAGSAATFSVARCNKSDKEILYTTSRNLRNVTTGVVTLLPDINLSLPLNCTRAISKINEIPESEKSGNYVAFGTAKVPGRFRTYDVRWNTEPFIVVGK